jgi:hypothetical protein
MSLKRTIEPTLEPVTVGEQKLHMRIDHSEEDGLIRNYIVAARRSAEAFLQRQLMPATWRLKLDGFPGSCWQARYDPHVLEQSLALPAGAIVLPMPPLRTISSITYVDTAGATQTMSSALYTVDTDSDPGMVYPIYAGSWPDTRDVRQAVTITFTAGYDNVAAIPENIRAGIRMMAAHLYENREATSEAVLNQVPLGVKHLWWQGRNLSIL